MADLSLADKLCNASARGNLHEVSFLLQNQAHVNGKSSYNRTALQVVKLGCPAVVEALLEAGANPNVLDPILDLTVTHDAAREGFVDTVRLLVDHGADVNLCDRRGNLPLHLAAMEGHFEVVQMLIGRTADPLKVNNEGYTPGQLAHLFHREDAASCIEEYLRSRE